tara:strand:- start:2295 stop:2522 length:228 start_codon:yes stop_codon:yes gene_type:complete
MDFEDQIELDHLLLKERKCRSCGKVKDLIEDFYLTRRDRTYPSAYSYECKVCTRKRVIKSRKNKSVFIDWSYPDW